MNREHYPLISISIPVYNEEKNILTLYERLTNLARKMKDRCRIEFVFSDNHSQDKTWQILTNLAKKDKNIKAIRFSKNFGFQRSILANYIHTKGDAVMQIDADLQDPPEMLEDFYALWKKGYKVVYGIRTTRQEGIFITFLRKAAYRIINFLSEHYIPYDAGDFRLIDRQIIDILKQYKTHDLYIRGLIAEMGFKQTGITYTRSPRLAGKSKFNFITLITFTFSAIFNHSSVPLRIASISGVIILGISFFGSLYYLILKIINPNLPEGLASIHILLLFAIGFHSLLLGIIGEYILRIYHILRAEPVAIIEQKINIETDNLSEINERGNQ